jgi:hypothetical protein
MAQRTRPLAGIRRLQVVTLANDPSPDASRSTFSNLGTGPPVTSANRS